MIEDATTLLSQTRLSKGQRPADRRAAIRYSSGHCAWWRRLELSATGPLEAQVKDISATGIGLVTRTPFNQGDVLLIRLMSDGGSAGARLARFQPLRVRRVVRLAEEEWLLGCAFVSPLHESELFEYLTTVQAESGE